MIRNQDGPVSEGTCKMCGERREFNNGYKWSPYRHRATPPAAPIEAAAAEPAAPAV